MNYIFTFIAFISISNASTTAINPLPKDGITNFMSFIQNKDKSLVGVLRSNAGKDYLVINSESYYVFDLDINNDGKNEYVIVDVGGGSSGASGIYKVISKTNEKYDFNKIVSKNLWNDDSGDLSKFHIQLADPAFVKRDSKTIIRYVEKVPSVKFYEYIWENGSFKKI
jgi:hypothetical protein